jgi:hypothetical protein
MTDDFPRVLHVGFNPIGSPTNTGLTLGSMFAQWPRDRLFEVYSMSRQQLVRADNVVVAPPSSAPVDGLARRLLGSRLPAPVTDGLNSAVSRKGVPTPLSVRSRVALSMLNDIGPVWTGGRWVDEVRASRPEVLHSLLGGVRITRLVLSLARRLDVPIVPHFMDDWLGTLYVDGQLLGLARREVDRLMSEVLARSPLCIAIGRDMQAEYAATLGKECRVVGNSVDFDAFDTMWRPGAHDARHRTISYVGGLHLGRGGVLREVGRAIARHQRVDGPSWGLRLFVPPADLDAAQGLAGEVPTIEVGGTLPPDEVPAALVASDALLFVESSDPSVARFTRMSVSTKVPEYLAARRPVLVVGPADQASVRALTRSAPATYGGGGLDAAALDQAWARTVSMSLNAAAEGPLPEFVRDEFGQTATRERLRAALAAAVAAS